MKCWHTHQCDWTLKTWCRVKEARHTRSHAVGFHWYEMSRIENPWGQEAMSTCIIITYGCQGRRGGEIEGWLPNGHGVGLFVVMEMFWNEIVVVVAHHRECTKRHPTVYFRWWILGYVTLTSIGKTIRRIYSDTCFRAPMLSLSDSVGLGGPEHLHDHKLLGDGEAGSRAGTISHPGTCWVVAGFILHS